MKIFKSPYHFLLDCSICGAEVDSENEDSGQIYEVSGYGYDETWNEVDSKGPKLFAVCSDCLVPVQIIHTCSIPNFQK